MHAGPRIPEPDPNPQSGQAARGGAGQGGAGVEILILLIALSPGNFVNGRNPIRRDDKLNALILSPPVRLPFHFVFVEFPHSLAIPVWKQVIVGSACINIITIIIIILFATQ